MKLTHKSGLEILVNANEIYNIEEEEISYHCMITNLYLRNGSILQVKETEKMVEEYILKEYQKTINKQN